MLSISKVVMITIIVVIVTTKAMTITRVKSIDPDDLLT